MPPEANVPFHRVRLDEEEIGAVEAVLRSGWLTTGAQTRLFEEEFASFIGARNAVAVSSGTAALHLMLVAHGVGEGDEVIVPTHTFTATASAVVHAGARPVVADVDPVSLNITAEQVERLISSRTRAVLAVHFGGVHCELQKIREVIGEQRLILEDAAHALPCWDGARHAGSASDGAAFSFYATKTLTTGEGGMLTLADETVARRARKLAAHGLSKDALARYGSGSWRYDVEDVGFKYNLSDVASALGREQLLRVVRRREERHQIAEQYDRAFSGHAGLQVPYRRDGDSDSWHLYVLRLNLEHLDCSRDAFLDDLRAQGIGANVHFVPLHAHSAYQRLLSLSPAAYPASHAEYLRSVSLPIWPGMTRDEVDIVTSQVISIADAHLRST